MTISFIFTLPHEELLYLKLSCFRKDKSCFYLAGSQFFSNCKSVNGGDGHIVSDLPRDSGALEWVLGRQFQMLHQLALR